jgi:hypothetical protein
MGKAFFTSPLIPLSLGAVAGEELNVMFEKGVSSKGGEPKDGCSDHKQIQEVENFIDYFR